MKKLPKIFLLIILFLSYGTQIHAYGDKYSPDEIFELYSDKNSKFTVLIFFNGLGSGIFHTNATSEYDNNKPLYCPPGDLSMGPEDYFKIYRSEYFRNKELWDSMSIQPPGWMLLQGLITEYPCN